jgi:hypothetical protein
MAEEACSCRQRDTVQLKGLLLLLEVMEQLKGLLLIMVVVVVPLFNAVFGQTFVPT